MKRALMLAREATGLVGPRPPVGAVLVKDDRVVGEGRTAPSPGPHAEIAALQAAGAEAAGATLYCTLEPCVHTGATPPCCDAIIGAGVRKVIAATGDPNPLVNGGGFARLRAAGIDVETGVAADDAEAAEKLIEGFVCRLQTGRPLVIAKFAMSLDGRIATRTGESRWITGEAAREEAHRLRESADAVMVGIGTVLADDPLLTARRGDAGTARPRLRVVADSSGRMPESARMFSEPGEVLWARAAGAPPPYQVPGLTAIELPRGRSGLDLSALLDALGKRGCTSLLVEGGGRLLGSFFDLRLVDRAAVFIAPIIIGGAGAPGPVAGEGVNRLSEALHIRNLKVRTIGSDVLLTGRVERTAGG